MRSNFSSIRLSMMGRPITVRTPEPALLAAVAEAYAGWDGTSDADGPAITLDLEASEGTPGPVEIKVDGPRLSLSGAGVAGWADAKAMTASCRLPRALADRPWQLASDVTDTLLLFLLCRSGRTPLHAAGVMCGKTAALLTGPSGSGKSTLSLAAMARGLRILSDDTVYIQMLPRLRIWGFPGPVHVFPADATGFTGRTRLRGGKLKVAAPTPPWREPPVADRAAVVLLERGDRVRLQPVDGAVAAAALAKLEPGFDLLGRESAEAIAALTAGGAWRLSLTHDPSAAIAALVERFGAEVGSVAASMG